MDVPSSDIAFTPTIKAIQAARGSRATYARMEARGGFRTDMDENLAAFLEGIDTAYLATANAAGQPYAQHRGGPKGFIRVLGPQTLGWTDYVGNRQYVTLGNLSENPKAFIFLMDYANSQRVKLWGTARVVEDDRKLIQSLADPNYPAEPERAILFTIQAWDINCPQHIHKRFSQRQIAPIIERLEHRVQELEAQLRNKQGTSP